MSRNRVLVLLLVVSAALNLAFIASRVYSRSAPARTSVPPDVEFQTALRIDPAQKQGVDALLRKFKIDSIAFKEDIVAKRIELLEELGDPGYDVNRIREKTAELNQTEAGLNDRFIDVLLEIIDILTPGQRLELLYQLSTNWYFVNHNAEKGGQHE